jgi:hypothetical protein
LLPANEIESPLSLAGFLLINTQREVWKCSAEWEGFTKLFVGEFRIVWISCNHFLDFSFLVVGQWSLGRKFGWHWNFLSLRRQ